MTVVRSGLMFGFAALALFVLLTLLQAHGLNLLMVLVLGVVAGNAAVSSKRRASVGRGLTAGLIGGLVMLVGSFFAGMLIVNLLRSEALGWAIGIPFITWIPVVGDTIDNANEWAAPWLRSGGMALGGCLGIVNFMLMAIGGAVGGMMGRR